MALIATLEDFSFLELIHSSVTYQKTGVFTFRSKVEEQVAEVYIQNGEIVHATYNNKEGEEALVDLFFKNEGSLTFTIDLTAPKRTIVQDSLELIIAYAERVDEIRKIQHQLPSLDIILVRSPQPERGLTQIDITLDQWQVLSLANGHRTIRDIIKDSGKSDVIIKEMLIYLIECGLLVDPVAMERIVANYLSKLNNLYSDCNVPQLYGTFWSDVVAKALKELSETNLTIKFIEFDDKEFKIKGNTLIVSNRSDSEEYYVKLRDALLHHAEREFGKALIRYKTSRFELK